MANNNQSKSTDVSYIRHDNEGRVNIPTQELKDFVAQDEVREAKKLYPRDPSLDPQLVWKGKDEQDQEDLAVPTVPIYIQEKIHPSAIIEDLKARSAKGEVEPQLDLFGDFNGIEDFEKKVDFYHHEGHWTNRMILGDSLLVMNSLAEKEGLKGKVQCIYFDPPYGIKFGSNWQVSTRKRQVGDKAEDASRQPEQVRAFRDTWKLGIHSFLGYARDRLVVARELLTESGSIFLQIGDENVHLLRNLLEEVFGAENFVGQIVFQKTGAFDTKLIQRNQDYILWFAKSIEHVKYRPLFMMKQVSEYETTFFDCLEEVTGDRRELTPSEKRNVSLVPDGAKFFARNPLNSEGWVDSLGYEFVFRGKAYLPPPNRHWTTRKSGLETLKAADRLIERGRTLRYVRYWADYPAKSLGSVWLDTGTGGFFGDQKFYVVQTDSKVIERCLLMATDPGDVVLDPTCGSGTTAYVAEQWGRRWITVDTSRVALTLARTRLMAGRFPFYLLSDSPEGTKKEAEITGKTPPTYSTSGDIRKGFVYKRVPHITLGAIANNPEIEGIAEKYQPKLDEQLGAMNRFRPDKTWNEWEVPAPPYGKTDNEPAEMEPFWKAFDEFWRLRREKQAEIDAAILRHSETELLFDQPYEDNKRLRVTGPFTVESLAPHRVMRDTEEEPLTVAPIGEPTKTDFSTMILDNLRKSGVQNTRKNERLKFETLESFAGLYLHAKGTYTDATGTIKTVAVSIGPEFGTVGQDWVKEAAKEAVKGVGFDLLIVCGFSFDGYTTEEAKNFGALTVLPVRMNNDLSMGDELLKKTGAGNLFMVFGEPDLKIQTESEGQISVEIQGLDVYDPTTGQIRSGSTDDIAVWFIDTNYNGESFFVRQAYFLGADDPFAKLKRALRAEVDEDAWNSLYSTRSQTFAKPTTGRIAVKVINHYGDEVLKVYEVK